MSLSQNSEKYELIKQLSKNSANIQINEKVNKKIKNTKKTVLHLANNAKDKWLLILCRAKGGIENIPKIFLANLDTNSLFTQTDLSNDETSNNKNDTFSKHSKSESTGKLTNYSQPFISDQTYKQTSYNLTNQKLINSLFEIRYELKREIDSLNSKMLKIDEKILILIQNFSYKFENKDPIISPSSEKTSIDLTESLFLNQLNSQGMDQLEDLNSNKTSSVLTTYNEITKIPKSTTNISIADANKLSATQIKKSKSFIPDSTTKSVPKDN